MNSKKVAIIDLGTNTFHLMIAEIQDGARHILLRERLAVKIGLGGINERIITDGGIQRAVTAMKQFRATIDRYGVQEIFAIGTSALRDARNGMEVADLLEERSGISVRIISGDEEASYIYAGVRVAVPMNEKICLIVDIGGGSVEFIVGNATSIFWKHSFEIGAQRLLERFQKHDPITTDEIADLMNYLAEALRPLDGVLEQFNPPVIVGSSGTFDTLSEMYCLRENIPYDEHAPETPLTPLSFYRSFEELRQKNRAGRLAMPGMIEMRVDMIVVACCVIDHLLKRGHFETIRVSTYSLKEGVLFS